MKIAGNRAILKIQGINGTKVECKAILLFPEPFICPCINGTKVECKASWNEIYKTWLAVLMEPKWNVKKDAQVQVIGTGTY